MPIPVREAKLLIDQLKQQEISLGRPPETWYTYENHVFGTAKIAQLIAAEINAMNPDKVYVCGLLHDICRIEEERVHRFHGILGYEKLLAKDNDAARACLLHMFPYCKLPPYTEYPDLFYNKKEDYDFISDYLTTYQPTDEDYLIQLCDNLANKDGFVTIEQRAQELRARKRDAYLTELVKYSTELKQYFDKKIGHDIYDFYKINKPS